MTGNLGCEGKKANHEGILKVENSETVCSY